MNREQWKKVQQRLQELGFYVGEGADIDGLPGPLTVQAVKAFQKAKDLDVKFPGTVGPKTLAALGMAEQANAIVDDFPSLPWLTLAQHRTGLHEEKDFKELRDFLLSDENTLGDPRKLPWCGDFIQTVIALSLPQEPMVAQPYLARGWLKFGVECPPCLGAVAVFWRGKKSGTSGHVGLLVGEDDGHWYVLGGNQSNAINVMKLAKTRLLGTRWPKTHTNPNAKLPRAEGGVLSTNEA